MSKTNINIRIEKSLKQEAEKLLEELGLNMTTAITTFLKQTINYRGIPFELKIREPNEVTLDTLKNIERNEKLSKEFNNVEDLFKELNVQD